MKVLASLFVASLVLAKGALAGVVAPPEKIERESYVQWLGQINSPVSPFNDWTFQWLEEQLTKPLPSQVNSDPDKLYVNVNRVLEEAIRVEDEGEAPEGTTYGLETFGIVNAPIDKVLETILFRWGKPVGAASGVTYPNDTVFGYRQETLSPEWGPGAYKTFTIKKNGGVAKDMNDSFSLLVRGNATSGYVLVGSFLGPIGDTTNTSFITMIIIRPMSDGKPDYRVAGLLNGQNYSFFGLNMGRKSFGFNASRIRDGQKDFLSQVAALKNTGKIPERKPR